MKISGVDIRPGNIIEYEGGIWRAVKIQHTQPGKGGAYMQVEMKNLIDGRKTNVRFRSAETVERVALGGGGLQPELLGLPVHDHELLGQRRQDAGGRRASSHARPAAAFRAEGARHVELGAAGAGRFEFG